MDHLSPADVLQLLEAGCQIELATARLYQVLAEAHSGSPTIAALWRKTAREEEQHAAQFRLAMGHVGPMVTGIMLELEDAAQAIARIEALTERYRAEPPNVVQALQSAIQLENGLRDLHLDRAGQFVQPRFRKLFRAMMAADEDHIESLKRALERYAG